MNTDFARRMVSVLAVLLALLAVGGAGAMVMAGPLAQSLGSEGEEGAAASAALAPAQSAGDQPDEEGYTGAPAAAAGDVTEGSEPASGAESVAAASAPAASAPQPDEEGYTGPVPEASASVADPSEEAPLAAAEGEPIMPEPQADDNDGAQAAETADPEWTSFHYIFVAGTTLLPRNSSVQWTYGAGGCVYSNSTDQVLNIHLDIPDGSRIDYLRIYYYDTSAANGQAWVTTYNGAGATNDLVSVQSSGNSGFGYKVSAYVGHVVDTSTRAYVLNWRPNQTGASMRLCGMRVAYRLPT